MLCADSRLLDTMSTRLCCGSHKVCGRLLYYNRKLQQMLLLALLVDGDDDGGGRNDNVNSKKFENEIQVLICFYYSGFKIIFFWLESCHS